VRAVVGYVPQDDILPGTSTVWEFLSFHAALRLAGQDAEAQGARVWQVRTASLHPNAQLVTAAQYDGPLSTLPTKGIGADREHPGNVLRVPCPARKWSRHVSWLSSRVWLDRVDADARASPTRC
jgi:hypothetical protein